MTAVPLVSSLQDMAPSWVDALIASLGEINGTGAGGPTALPFGTGWGAYGGGWADPQVSKWGRIVVSCGLAKNISGATITPNAGNYTICTIPVGYRPRAIGAASPLGGYVNTSQYNGVLTSQSRVQFTHDGFARVIAGPAIPANSYVALVATWITD